MLIIQHRVLLVTLFSGIIMSVVCWFDLFRVEVGKRRNDGALGHNAFAFA